MSRALIIAAIGAVLSAGAVGYWLGRQEALPSVEPQATQMAAPAAAGGATADDRGRVLYYRNPMGLADTSPTPKKDSMGMAYIPVHEGEAADAGIVSVTPGRLQTLGVRTAPVETRAAMTRSIRATGIVQFNERRLATVTTKVEGWIEKLQVSATGDAVRQGQVLAWIYAPDLVAAEREYLVATALANAAQDGASHGEPGALIEAAARRLRALGIPPEEILRLQRDRQAAWRIAVHAPTDGIIIDKPAIEGMRVAPGEPLYRIGDLSTVWLIAEVQESELSAVQAGQPADACFVAFPGRTF